MNLPLRLRIDHDALADNWRTLDRLSGRAACGAAVKANGYGLGARGVVKTLAQAGCRDFFVSIWAEAAELADLSVPVSVLHGVREEDMADALASANARPVLNSPEQIRRWRDAGGGACDVMVDTGMNRLGVSVQDVADGLLDGLAIETLMSHLACADEDVPMNARQRDAFAALAGATAAKRMSLANSAGIALGQDYALDLTRPGLALYGGVPREELADVIRQVVTIEAQVLQVRTVRKGDTVGYGATWIAPKDTRVAIVNLGYADGYFRGFSNRGTARYRGIELQVVGRVSMDLVAVDVSETTDLRDSAWFRLSDSLPSEALKSGISQYELLTGLDTRLKRWGG